VPALIDAHHLGQGQTGNETWARNVVAELARRPSRTHVAVTAAGRATLPDTWTPDRVHEVSMSSSRRLAYDLPRLTRRLRPDALLVQYSLPPFASRHVPGVVMVHDLSFERPEASAWIAPRTLARYRTTIRSSVRRARIVLVPTEWTRLDVLRTYGLAPDRVAVAGNAVDAELAQQLAAIPRAKAGEESVVLAVGTVLPRKNLLVLARAIRVLRSQGEPVRLRVVGPIPMAGQATARQLREVLGDALDLVGPVPVARLAQEYRSADLLAFPSLFEGFGIPVVEAMAAGLPVVSSTATCLPEVGGNAARYADPDDVEAWAATLGELLGAPEERARLAAAGLVRAGSFSWRDTADAVETALLRAAS
jgi:glycosyltransferase involved in cell wall biosynthesis